MRSTKLSECCNSATFAVEKAGGWETEMCSMDCSFPVQCKLQPQRYCSQLWSKSKRGRTMRSRSKDSDTKSSAARRLNQTRCQPDCHWRRWCEFRFAC